MKKLLKLGHVIKHKATILTHRIATEWRLASWNVLGKKINQFNFSLRLSEGRGLNLVDEATFPMRGTIPAVHRVKQGIPLMNHQNRPFCYDGQIRLSDDDSHLDDAFLLRVQTRHLHIQPYQTELIRNYFSILGRRCLRRGLGHIINPVKT